MYSATSIGVLRYVKQNQLPLLTNVSAVSHEAN